MVKLSRSKKRRQRRLKLYGGKSQIDLRPKLDRAEEAQDPVKLGARSPIIVSPTTADTEYDKGDDGNKDIGQPERTVIEALKKRRRRKTGRLMNDPNDGTVPEPALLTEIQRMRLEHCKLAMRVINEQIAPDIRHRAKRILRLLKESGPAIEPLDEVSKNRLIAYINHAFATKSNDHDKIRKRTRGLITATRKLGGKRVFDRGATVDNSSRVPAR